MFIGPVMRRKRAPRDGYGRPAWFLAGRERSIYGTFHKFGPQDTCIDAFAEIDFRRNARKSMKRARLALAGPKKPQDQAHTNDRGTFGRSGQNQGGAKS